MSGITAVIPSEMDIWTTLTVLTTRGGFTVSLMALRDDQFMSETASVLVPWDNKELAVEFATFRDKLRPGSKETWRVTVKGATSRKSDAGRERNRIKRRLLVRMSADIQHDARSVDLLHETMTRARQPGLRVQAPSAESVCEVVGDAAYAQAQLAIRP